MDTQSQRIVPATVYVVEVLEVIRGDANGQVTVHQSGIFDDYTTLAVTVGPPLLEEGELAVFVAVWENDVGWYDLVSGRVGHRRLADDATRDTVVAEFRAMFATPATYSPNHSGSPSAQP